METYKEYCEKLRQSLSRMHNADKEEAINYYSEYAIDAGFTTYNEMENNFGTPKNLAAKIYSEAAIKELDVDNKKKGSSTKALWIGLMALFSLPMAFPLVIASSAILFAFLVSFAAILFAIIVTVGSLGITSLALFIKSFSFLMPFKAALWLKSFGGSIAIAAIVIVSLIGMYFAIKYLSRSIVLLISKFVKRRTNHD